MLSISIVGAGRLGGALAVGLERAGFRLAELVYRNTPPSTDLINSLLNKKAVVPFSDTTAVAADIVFITTQDSGIAAAASWLGHSIIGTPNVFITSGAYASPSISSLKHRGCPIGSIHPLISISDPISGSEKFSGAYFCLEGDPGAVENARSIVDALGGQAFSIETEKKPLYHAAAVTACGHLVALIDVAAGMLEKAGLERRMAETILLPLVNSTIENLSEHGIEKALTGPFARGDNETVESHLQALRANIDADDLRTYLNLGERSLEIAMRGAGSNSDLAELQKKVSMAKKESR